MSHAVGGAPKKTKCFHNSINYGSLTCCHKQHIKWFFKRINVNFVCDWSFIVRRVWIWEHFRKWYWIFLMFFYLRIRRRENSRWPNSYDSRKLMMMHFCICKKRACCINIPSLQSHAAECRHNYYQNTAGKHACWIKTLQFLCG